MTLPNFPFELSLTLDIILIVICGFSSFYCIRLSGRLSKLNNLKSGVGASIISLTEAIEQTHAATQDSQTTTVQTIETLRHLISNAESTITRMEAKQIDLDHNVATTRALKKHLSKVVEVELTPSIMKAQNTAKSISSMLQDLETYRIKNTSEFSASTQDDQTQAHSEENNLSYFYADAEDILEGEVTTKANMLKTKRPLKLIASQ